MRLHYKGKYDLNPDSLPCGTHQIGAVAFKEIKDSKTLGIIASIMGFGTTILLLGGLYLRFGTAVFSTQAMLGYLLSLLVLFPHELLHAICFKEDVYLYTNIKHGMLFVTGPETMSKGRFIFMSLLPNVVFGIIPYIIAMIYPSLIFLGTFGALSIGMGAGDYYNVFNAITQMPKRSRTYLFKFHSFWYISDSN